MWALLLCAGAGQTDDLILDDVAVLRRFTFFDHLEQACSIEGTLEVEKYQVSDTVILNFESRCKHASISISGFKNA